VEDYFRVQNTPKGLKNNCAMWKWQLKLEFKELRKPQSSTNWKLFPRANSNYALWSDKKRNKYICKKREKITEARRQFFDALCVKNKNRRLPKRQKVKGTSGTKASVPAKVTNDFPLHRFSHPPLFPQQKMHQNNPVV